MKPTNFRWAYDGAELRNDPKMTRQTMAKMIRSWRKHGFSVYYGFHSVTVRTGGLIARADWSK